MKKVLLVSISLMLSIVLFSCGSNTQATQTDPQVAELQKQLADLQQQVNQNQQTQQVQPTQIAQTQVSQAQQNNQVQNVGQVVQGNGMVGSQTASITLDQAKQIATANAGFDVNSVTYIKTIQDYDDGFLKWEVDFVANNVKYEYDISATNGTILKAEREGVAMQGGYVPPVNAGQQVAQGNVSAGTQGIDVEQAKSIATQHAGFTVAGVTFVKQKYDFDDGIAKWEIEFVVNTNKYEYEVSAANGTIVKYKVESIYND